MYECYIINKHLLSHNNAFINIINTFFLLKQKQCEQSYLTHIPDHLKKTLFSVQIWWL